MLKKNFVNIYKSFFGKIFILLGFIVLISFFAVFPKSMQQIFDKTLTNNNFNNTSKILGSFPNDKESFRYDSCVFSPTGYKVACEKIYLKDGYKSSVAINNEEQQKYEDIKELKFSPNGESLAYIATKNNKMVVVLNGKEGEDQEFISNLTFSPDSKSLVYLTGKEYYKVGEDPFFRDAYKKISVVKDGQTIQEFGSIIEPNSNQLVPIISPNGEHIALSFNEANKESKLYVDSKLIFTSSDRLSAPVFTGDSKKIIVIPYKFIDGNHVGNIYVLDLEGKVIKKIDQLANINSIATDKAGENIVYTTRFGNYLYINNDQTENAPSFRNLSISSITGLLAYLKTTSGNKILVGDPSTSPTEHLIVNGRDIFQFFTFEYRTSNIVFSPDGNSIGFLVAASSTKKFDPTLSKLIIANKQKSCVVPFVGRLLYRGDYDVSRFSELQDPIFSPDGKYIGFGYLNDNDLYWDVRKIDFNKCNYQQ